MNLQFGFINITDLIILKFGFINKTNNSSKSSISKWIAGFPRPSVSSFHFHSKK